MRLRKLNVEGLSQFEAWLAEGGHGEVPARLANNSTTSTPVMPEIELVPRSFADRYAFGKYLVKMLESMESMDAIPLSTDRLLWSTLALVWFDQLCPKRADGSRKLDQSYRYVLSTDYRHYYRHLVRSPWQLVRDHGENAKFLLLPTVDTPHPLRRHGEILEQLGGRQSVLRSSVSMQIRKLVSLGKGWPETAAAAYAGLHWCCGSLI